MILIILTCTNEGGMLLDNVHEDNTEGVFSDTKYMHFVFLQNVKKNNKV